MPVVCNMWYVVKHVVYYAVNIALYDAVGRMLPYITVMLEKALQIILRIYDEALYREE